jgi:hypothetical protein
MNRVLWLLFIGVVVSILCDSAAAVIGEFSGHSDIGGPKRPGFASFDSRTGNYKVAGGGKNMWFTNDALHFVWTQANGDGILAADIEFEGMRYG